MLKTFQKWLLGFILLAVFCTSVLAFFSETYKAKRQTVQQIDITLNYLKNQISIMEQNIKEIKHSSERFLLEKAKILAFIIEKNPALMKRRTFFNEFANIAGLFQINVSDPKGTLILSVPRDISGVNMGEYPETKPYLDLIWSKNNYYIEEPRMARLWNKTNFMSSQVQFVGVSRRDKPGIIQVGHSIERYEGYFKTEKINTLASSLKTGQTGHVFIIKDDIIVSSDLEALIGKTLKQIDLKIPEFTENRLVFTTSFNGQNVFGVAEKYDGYELAALLPESEMLAQRNNTMVGTFFFFLILFSAIFVLNSELLKRVVIKGIQNTNLTLSKITAGNLDEKVDIQTNPEFKALSKGINATVDALKEAIAQTKAKINQELYFAQEIQRSALPNVFPPYPHHTEFDVYATMDAAKEIGGDFYDFLTVVDGSKLAFLIADVSGKGIPAALFMMSAKTLIKNYAQAGYSVGEIFRLTNNELCENNETSMFLTALMGILEINTGRLTYVNAAHDLPFFQKRGNEFFQVELESNYPLGVIPDAVFGEKEILLRSDDTIFSYTDGITEAENKNGEFYGEERLLRVLNENRHLPVKDLILKVKADILEFAQDTEQSDDITILALRYLGEERTVPVQIEHQHEIADFISALLKKNDCPEEIHGEIEIMIDEIFTNISNYAYPNKDGTVSVFCSVGGFPKKATLRFTDSGIPFNPLNSVESNLDAPAEKRELGHLGIFLVKNLADEISYKYQEGKNILTIQKMLQSDSEKCYNMNLDKSDA